MATGTVVTGIGSDELFSIIAEGQLPGFSIGERVPKTEKSASGTVTIEYDIGHEEGSRLRVRSASMLSKPADDVPDNEGKLSTLLHYPVDDQDNSWFTTYVTTFNHPNVIFETMCDALEELGYTVSYYGEGDDMYWVIADVEDN